jgi:hypothetical protein
VAQGELNDAFEAEVGHLSEGWSHGDGEVGGDEELQGGQVLFSKQKTVTRATVPGKARARLHDRRWQQTFQAVECSARRVVPAQRRHVTSG